MTKTEVPPPGAVFDRAERAVEYVRGALRLTLDYQPETLPILDHYLTTVPHEAAPGTDDPGGPPPLVALIAAAAGAYFGEVVRQALGGEWRLVGEEPSWEVILPGGVRFSPIGAAVGAIYRDEIEGYEGGFEVAPEDREAVERALEETQVSVDEFYSLSGRLETLMTVVDLVVALHASPRPAPDEGEPS